MMMLYFGTVANSCHEGGIDDAGPDIAGPDNDGPNCTRLLYTSDAADE